MSTKKETAKLAKMKLNELQAKFAEVTGETTRSPNKTFLIRSIAEAVRGADASAKAENAPEAAAQDADAEGTTAFIKINGFGPHIKCFDTPPGLCLFGWLNPKGLNYSSL